MIIRQVCIYFFLLGSITAVCQPKPGLKVGLNHIAFMVKNLERSREFYQNVIRLDTIPEPFHDGKHIWLSIGGRAALHLIQGPYSQQSIKQSHICFSIPVMEKFVELLKDKGIAFENWSGQKQQITNRVDGVRQLYLQDPDGYWIEINDEQ
jgi:lactoylglutathione lyase